MKRDDPYTRMQRQQLASVGILVPLLTLVAIFQVSNPRNDLFVKVSFLVPYVILLIAGVFALLRYRSNLKRLDQRPEALAEETRLQVLSLL